MSFTNILIYYILKKVVKMSPIFQFETSIQYTYILSEREDITSIHKYRYLHNLFILEEIQYYCI